jgi:hypothetical protein
MIGPAGFGVQHFVAADATLEYTIEFENKATATAPAQEVVITQQLDPKLDFTTFELGDFGFGATTVAVPDARSFFSARVDARATVGVFVDVIARIDLASGLASWTFRSLDPTTLDLPADTRAGFLPPNDAAGGGVGFVSYHVRPRSGLATAAEIRSVAVIVFDTNAPIATNQVNPDDASQGTDPTKEAPVTIDGGPPSSGVESLPRNGLPTFIVHWAGQDDTAGSGIASYDIYVSDNGGDWLLWKTKTTQTSAVYTGLLGHRYAFYSVTRDNVGNQEAKLPHAEAVIDIPVIQTTLTEPAAPTRPVSVKIAALLGKHVSDIDKNPVGIAVTAQVGNGNWQFNAGTGWVNITALTATNALLLAPAAAVRFVPAGLWTGEADLVYVAWDGTSGTAGSRGNAAAFVEGGSFSSSAGMVTVNVTPIDHAPMWLTSTAALVPVLPLGTMVPASAPQTIQQAFGAVFSGDAGQPAGVAVTGLTGGANGTWQYRVYDSTTQTYGNWANITANITAATALLLSAPDQVQFIPTRRGFTGLVTLLVRAWDGSRGTPGAVLNLNKTGTGGVTAFSSAVLTAQLRINTAPTQQVQPAGGLSLGTITENVASTPVSIATLLKSTKAADPDGTTPGLALAAVTGPGSWQYQVGRGAWQAVPATVSATAALLLPSGALVRFVPAPNQVGAATIRWVAWDQTQGVVGMQGFDSTASGGANAFSSTTATAMLTVLAATGHVAPAWNGRAAALTPNVPGHTQPDDTVAGAFGPYFADAGTAGIAVAGLTGLNHGTWQYFDGTRWNPFTTAPSTGRAVLLPAAYRIRFVPRSGFLGAATLTAYAWDGSTGQAAAVVRAIGSAFSSATLTVTCLVNNAPTLTE